MKKDENPFKFGKLTAIYIRRWWKANLFEICTFEALLERIILRRYMKYIYGEVPF